MQCIDPTFHWLCMLCLVPSIIKKLKIHLQAAQKKCIGFCLKLNGRYSIKCRDFQKVNWLPIHQRVSQCSLCNIYTFFTKNCPKYFDEIYVPSHAFIIPEIKCSSSKSNLFIYLFVYLFIFLSIYLFVFPFAKILHSKGPAKDYFLIIRPFYLHLQYII